MKSNHNQNLTPNFIGPILVPYPQINSSINLITCAFLQTVFSVKKHWCANCVVLSGSTEVKHEGKQHY